MVMNEYIERLMQDDAMVSNSLHASLNTKTVPEGNSVLHIKVGDDEIKSHAVSMFSLDGSECHITFLAGEPTIKKIQSMINEKCNVSFYNFNRVLHLAAYQITQAGSAQMTATLKFIAG